MLLPFGSKRTIDNALLAPGAHVGPANHLLLPAAAVLMAAFCGAADKDGDGRAMAGIRPVPWTKRGFTAGAGPG